MCRQYINQPLRLLPPQIRLQFESRVMKIFSAVGIHDFQKVKISRSQLEDETTSVIFFFFNLLREREKV